MGAACDKPEAFGTMPVEKDVEKSMYSPIKAPVNMENEFFGNDQLEQDARDKKTPDELVRRHPNLVRLTGRHPFNCEPPLDDLKNAGFLTPPALHYVRNHGAVPVKASTMADRQETWNSWKIRVGGLVDRPLELTMEDIVALPKRQIPVLLVCAGNRRKEQNLIRQTIGFSWGAAGLACNMWTGVRLCDLLRLAGVTARPGDERHVCFNGPPKELPKGEDGSYGTSVPLTKALDPSNDILIAYRQNGQLLEPDHGFPVRLIIPGYIGGRMIKWLQEISVTENESDNFYHYRDNRVLPVGVTPESAEAEGWWFKPDYIINQLNINSAMWSPAHNETMLLANAAPTYSLGGYAYTGNGMKIIRVEVSFDNGSTWALAEINRPEKPTEYGKYWAWCFWSFEAQLADLVNCDEVMVRAWDACQNTQPKDPTWNVMGMMNNPWFRIRVHKVVDTPGADPVAVRFEHPTLAGPQDGGWMTQDNNGWKRTDTGALFGLIGGQHTSGVATAQTLTHMSLTAAPGAVVAAPAPAAAPVREIPAEYASLPRYTSDEVAKHDQDDDCWIVVAGLVYNATPYLEEHPGGASSIIMNAGIDATEEFEAIHSPKAWAALKPFIIGVLEDGSVPASLAPAPIASATPVAVPETEVALNPRRKVTVTLLETLVIGNDGTNDVKFLRFGLPRADQRLGLPTGQHFMVYATVDGKPVARAYTPISNDHQRGSVDMVVKIYNQPGREGKLSSHLGSLQEGDSIDLKGPIGHVTYDCGVFTIGKATKPVRHVGMIAGGSGITPMYQVVQTALRDPEDTTCFHIIYANQNCNGIMLQETLDEWAKEHPGRVTVRYVVDVAPPAEEERPYSVGYINSDMIEEFICAPSGGAANVDLAFLCGPKPMIDRACIPNLEKIGIPADKHVQF